MIDPFALAAVSELYTYLMDKKGLDVNNASIEIDLAVLAIGQKLNNGDLIVLHQPGIVEDPKKKMQRYKSGGPLHVYPPKKKSDVKKMG